MPLRLRMTILFRPFSIKFWRLRLIEDISDEEWELTFRVNIHAMFYLTKAAVPKMKEGGAIINMASINADKPNPTLLAYATTKDTIQNFTAGLAQYSNQTLCT
jgi:NAD(P)-dependent dehydrogenase (short-subunit alcohol dehydrogenase family)